MYSGRFWLNKLLAQTSCHVVIESAWLCNNYVEWLLVITHWSFYVTELIWSLGFWSVSAYIQLQDGHHCLNKQSSNATEIVCSSFGFITTLLPHSSLKSSEFISQLRDLLNTVDLSDISVDEQNERQANKEQPCASQHLEMPITPRNKTSSSVATISPYSGNWKRAKNKNISPNLKEISEKEDLDTVKFHMLYNHDVIRLQRKPNISSTCFSGLPTLVTEHAWYCGMSNT